MQHARFLIPGLSILLLMPSLSTAQSSLQHSSQAVTHSIQAIGESMVAGAKLVSGVAAVPLKAAGAVGTLSGDLGDSLWEAANAPVGAPLPVTDDAITVGPPPDKALKPETTP